VRGQQAVIYRLNIMDSEGQAPKQRGYLPVALMVQLSTLIPLNMTAPLGRLAGVCLPFAHTTWPLALSLLDWPLLDRALLPV
jgi:hypothetical protein